MKKIKILFQGDSITDAGRNRENYHDLGKGYPFYAAELLEKKYPQIEFEFINLGISGNQTKDLAARFEKDFLDVQPDIVSILIGINDVWHYSRKPFWLSDKKFEKRYRTLLEGLKKGTDAKIMMIEPFLIPVEDKLYFRKDLYKKIEIERKLAREFAAVYLPADGLLSSAFVGDDALSFAADGVHPTIKGAQYIAELYCQYMSKIIDDMIS